MVIERLRLAPEIDQPVDSQPRKMLGECRLAKLHPSHQLSNGKLAFRNQVTQDQKPLFVAEAFEQSCCV